MILVFETLRFLILLTGALFSSYTDLKKGLIYDKITYPMIAAGIIFIAIDLFTNQNLFLLLIPAMVFAFSYALYFTGKLGGGDVKFFLAMSLLLPYYQGEPFLLSALLTAALASAFIVSSLSLYKLFSSKKRPKIELNVDLIKVILLALLLLFYFTALWFLGTLSLIALLVFAPLLFVSLLFFMFRKQIQEVTFLRWVSPEEIEEDEIIAKEYLDKKTILDLGISIKGVLSEKDKNKVKALGISKLPVYRDLPPFAPFLLFGIIVAAVFPDFFSLLFAA